MKKFEIVKEHKDFDDIIASGKYIKNKYVVIYNKESNFEYPRFGVAVGKKVGHAVTRNKLKRILRMILTNNKKLFKKNHDYIIIGKRSALEVDYSALENSIKEIISGD